MAFNPTLPANGSQVLSPELRAQFNGLKDLIDAQGQLIADLQGQVATMSDQIDQGFNDRPTFTGMNNEIISNSAANVDGVSPVNGGVSNPPTQAQVTAIADRLDELINGLHRVPP